VSMRDERANPVRPIFANENLPAEEVEKEDNEMEYEAGVRVPVVKRGPKEPTEKRSLRIMLLMFPSGLGVLIVFPQLQKQLHIGVQEKTVKNVYRVFTQTIGLCAIRLEQRRYLLYV